MMPRHLLIHALSCTNLSGAQVLWGHLGSLLDLAPPALRISLLLPDGLDLPPVFVEAKDSGRLSLLRGPAWTRTWPGRLAYEALRLPRVIRRRDVDRLLTLSGTCLRRLPCPQVTLALNPWAFIPGIHTAPRDRLKAALQRQGYRRAMRRADGIGFASGHLRDLYIRDAGSPPTGASAIVYAGLDDEEIRAMDALVADPPPRDPLTILCVSRMAPHKNIETLLLALARLAQHAPPPGPRLRLVGGWSDPAYREHIDTLIQRTHLRDRVDVTGHLDRPGLRLAYRTARVYALLSRSESFGIPALEAQWMGTPVLAAHGSAAEEICGEGGLYADPDDHETAARHLQTLLYDEATWARHAEIAARRARRFVYRETSRPLLGLLGLEERAAA